MARSLAAILVFFALALAPDAALATYPGVNGKIAYTDVVDEGSPVERQAIFIHGQGQFTQPTARANASDSDSEPAWTPDGELMAFVRRDGLTAEYGIFVVKEDGTDLRRVFNTGQLVNGQPGALAGRPLSSLSWKPDGHSILFAANGSAWSVGNAHVGVDLPLGGGGSNVTLGQGTLEAGVHGTLSGCAAICVVDSLGGMSFFNVVLPGVSPVDLGGISNVGWWPRSNQRKVAFVGTFRADGIFFNEIFSVEYKNPNTTALWTRYTRVTPTTGLVACSNTVYGVTTITQRAQYTYRDPIPSPDGKYVLVHRTEYVPTYDDEDRCTFASSASLLQFRETGGLQLTLGEGSTIDDAAWQPSTANVAIEVSDGHDNGLDGLKVELRDADHPEDVLDDAPRNVEGGTYLFQYGPPGRYRIRVTLVDAENDAFEIRYGHPAVDAVWAEREIDVPANEIQSRFDFPIDGTAAGDGSIIDSNVGSAGDTTSWNRLDDLANVYYQVHRFVKWIRANLTQDTGAKLPFYVFAESTPFGDHAADLSLYLGDGDALGVYMGTSDSEHTFRDKLGDEAPENSEWHEFVHHLYRAHVSPELRAGCPDFLSSRNHGGWINPTTCDSLIEGFAEFLAALPEGNSNYAGMFDLQDHAKAWENIDLADLKSHEDVAVASLLWDLVDADAESEYAFGSDFGSLVVPVTYVDAVTLPLAELWNVLTVVQPKTVLELARALRFIPQFESLTVDLDSDGVFDVNAVDPLFLMHGFFPVISNLSGAPSAHVYRYDIKSARFRGLPANDDVGLSSHRFFHSNGTLALEYDPRYEKPRSERSNIAIHARDASGTPLKGVAVELTIAYPESETILERSVPTGDGDLVGLRLPPYFDYFLPEGEPLPACNPVEDRQVNATVRGKINGYESADTPSFDNCLYWQAALGGGAGNAALSVTLTFPEDSMPPVTTASARTLGSERLFGPPVGDYTLGGTWTIELSCDDPVDGGFASGCDRIEYSLDGGPFRPYEKEIDLVEPGLYTLQSRSFDAASNEETIRSQKLGIMSAQTTTRPTTTITTVASIPPVSGVTMGFWTVTMSCLAANSGTTPGAGCLRTEYSVDYGPFVEYTGAVVIAEPGLHTVVYRSIDILSNQETNRSVTLIVGGPDVTPPLTEIIVDSPAPSPFDASQAMGSWRVRLSNCLDDAYYTTGQEISGCASTEYSLDGGGFQAWTLGAEVIIEGVGQHVFEYRSIDVAGNQEPLRSRTLEIVPTADQDGDGSIDFADNCPAQANSDQLDADGDGVGDACNGDNDSDGDEWADWLDNCPVDSNSDQADLDLDGQGDVCDPFPEYDCYATGVLPRTTVFLAAFQNNTCESWYQVSQPGDDLRSAVLAAADLRFANLSGSNLSDANLTSADLSGADLSFAVLTDARYDESTIFPSGSSIAAGPWGLEGEVTPWNAGMIPTPEPMPRMMLLFGAAGLAALSRRGGARPRDR